MKKIIFIPILLFSLCVMSQDLFAEAGAQYKEALRLIREKKHDFAFMELRSILKDFPKSRYAQDALFGVAEYCYEHNMHYDAIKGFTEYINMYPDSKAVIFAKAYLLKIMDKIKNPTEEEKNALESIKRDFFSGPLFLLFSEYKETSYKSPFLNRFKIRYYFDNIEIYRNDEIFLKITQ